jgi:adenine phosphoribosyltransferase
MSDDFFGNVGLLTKQIHTKRRQLNVPFLVAAYWRYDGEWHYGKNQAKVVGVFYHITWVFSGPVIACRVVANGETSTYYNSDIQPRRDLNHLSINELSTLVHHRRPSSVQAENQIIARALPWYPYKSIERFYDVGTLMADATATELVVQRMANAAAEFRPTILGLLDARGFVFGSMMAARMHLPIALVRKPGKMPNTTSSAKYNTEYGHRDGVCLQRHVVQVQQRMVLVDDMVATGGTAGAAMACAEAMGITVVGFVSLVELDDFATQRVHVMGQYHETIPRASAITEEQLISGGAVAALLPDDYTDDGTVFESEGAMRKV